MVFDHSSPARDEPAPWTIAAAAADVAAVLARVAPAGAALAGHSWGG